MSSTVPEPSSLLLLASGLVLLGTKIRRNIHTF
ncbi:PEP-CTERM sorting domain-containing protein [Edaphobacter modestus]